MHFSETKQADMPALSPEIYSVFQDVSYNAVFDVGEIQTEPEFSAVFTSILRQSLTIRCFW